MSNTLNPFGTFGTGYDVGSYGTGSPYAPKYNSDDGGHRSSSSVGGPPPETLSTPAAIPLFSHTLKANRRVDFENNSLNAIRYEWIFYSKETLAILGRSTNKDPIVFFPSAGTYNVKLIAYNADGDYEEIILQVTVEYLVPSCDFTYIVSGTIVRFTDISNIGSDTALWLFGDGDFSTKANPHHTYPGNGIYTARLVKGSYSKTKSIVIDAEVILECDAMDGADGYKWERSANGVDGWVEFADTVVESVGVIEAIHGIDPTIVNFFRVKAYNIAGDSDYSDITNVRCE